MCLCPQPMALNAAIALNPKIAAAAGVRPRDDFSKNAALAPALVTVS